MKEDQDVYEFTDGNLSRISFRDMNLYLDFYFMAFHGASDPGQSDQQSEAD